MLGWEVVPRIGPVSLHGIGIMLGYLAGAYVMAQRAKKTGVGEDAAWSAASWAVVGAILGARIAYVAGHFSEFESPAEWLRIWEGGISLVGGLMGGWTAAYLYCRLAKINFWDMADVAAPGLAIGIALGRSGDLAIGDHLGKETAGWWGWQYRGGELISPPPCVTPLGEPVYSSASGCIEPGMVVHQTAIYDSIWSFVILGILVLLEKNPRRRGFMALAWMSLYALGRIATDFTRVDKTWFGLGLTGSQICSIIALVTAVILIVRFGGMPTRRGIPPVAAMWREVEEPRETPAAPAAIGADSNILSSVGPAMAVGAGEADQLGPDVVGAGEPSPKSEIDDEDGDR